MNKVVDSCRRNNIALNVGKCAVMSTTHSNDKVLFSYAVEGDVLERVATKKDFHFLKIRLQ